MAVDHSLFLQQTYLDAWSDYQRSLTRPTFPRWDMIILTASNEDQAEAYRMQITLRQNKGLLPEQTHFAVLPDPEDKRVGSGGATLNALRYIRAFSKEEDPFADKRILVIHSGGDSKRVPQYSVCGKLFSPVPRELPNGQPSTLFDEFMIGMSGVPGRIQEGMLLLSGDVLLLFNPLQIDFSGQGAAVISFKEDAEVGKNHGVFAMDAQGDVGAFLHKQSIEQLRANGAMNDRGKVDIDTGMVLLSRAVLHALHNLISADGKHDARKFAAFVNGKSQLSLYGDFLYPFASQATLEQYYEEKPEGTFCEELRVCRTALWETLHPFRMKLLRLAPSAFIHFGTSCELLRLMTNDIAHFSFLDWSSHVSTNGKSGAYASYNSLVMADAQIEPQCYIENSEIGPGTTVGAGTILSSVALLGQRVPEHVVLHAIPLRDGRCVARIYGVTDNPKEFLERATLFGAPLSSFLERNGLAHEDLWPQGGDTLWLAALYPVCNSMAEAVDAALNVYAMAHGQGDIAVWRRAQRKSLCAGLQEADARAAMDWAIGIRKKVKATVFLQSILNRETYQCAREVFQGEPPDRDQREWLEKQAMASEVSLRMRIFYYLGKAIGGTEGERMIDRCFATIQESIVQSAPVLLKGNQALTIVHDAVQIRLPLRVNWGGGWSDTPPYCNEKGGAVLNAAISLGGELPVNVEIRRLSEQKVVLESADTGAHGEFCSLDALVNCQNPYDPFALHKAALLACGVLPMHGGDLTAILQRTRGGILLSTQVHGVPKGSGLGTSSILAGACVKAICEFFGIACTQEEVFDRVLCMEQLMSTGGGWQDQVGGLVPGIKFITSPPGMKQRIHVEAIHMPEQALRELNDRFALIYTGQRRLARNLLRDVVGRYVGAQPEALEALESIQQVAALMRFDLERGNVDDFANHLSHHWELSKRLDQGSTNTCIEQIFRVIEDLICGQMICGAGGGGFLQVVLKRGVTKEQLRTRILEVFQDSGVDVWNFQLV